MDANKVLDKIIKILVVAVVVAGSGGCLVLVFGWWVASNIKIFGL